MTSIISVSSAELSQRRLSLRRQRRRQLIYGIWRILALGSLAGGLVWGTTQPVWVIRKPDQIAVEGNQHLSPQAIRSLLSLTYPQSLLKIEPSSVAENLETRQSLIAKATVTRQLFPPSLTVKIQERQPVAIALSPGKEDAPLDSTSQPKEAPAGNEETLSQLSPLGLVDANGAWIPIENYDAVKQSLPLPTLKIIGDGQQYLPYWPEMYKVLRRSPVKVSEIDWQNPSNVILKTDIGIVHLGPFGSQFAEQLNVLDRMRQLSAKINGRPIAYIDLKDPDSPAIQLLEPSTQDRPERENSKMRSKRT